MFDDQIFEGKIINKKAGSESGLLIQGRGWSIGIMALTRFIDNTFRNNPTIIQCELSHVREEVHIPAKYHFYTTYPEV